MLKVLDFDMMQIANLRADNEPLFFFTFHIFFLSLYFKILKQIKKWNQYKESKS